MIDAYSNTNLEKTNNPPDVRLLEGNICCIVIKNYQDTQNPLKPIGLDIINLSVYSDTPNILTIVSISHSGIKDSKKIKYARSNMNIKIPQTILDLCPRAF